MKRLSCWVLLLPLALGLGACTNMRLIDSQTTSFAAAQIPAQARFSFERLPSQQTPLQDTLERMALASLTQAGLRFDANSAQYRVQVSGTLRMLTTYPNPGLSGSIGWGMGGWRPGLGGRYRMAWFDNKTLYLREASLILRDAATGAVAYETHASNDNPWPDDDAIWGALIDAALQGFPNPPPGPRQVSIDIPW